MREGVHMAGSVFVHVLIAVHCCSSVITRGVCRFIRSGPIFGPQGHGPFITTLRVLDTCFVSVFLDELKGTEQEPVDHLQGISVLGKDIGRVSNGELVTFTSVLVYGLHPPTPPRPGLQVPEVSCR